MVTKKEREAAEKAAKEAAEAKEAETAIETVEQPETPAETPAEQPETEQPETEKVEIEAFKDIASLFEEERAHIAEDAERFQFAVRMPDFNGMAEGRNPKFKAFANIWGVRDTNGDVVPDLTSAQIYAAVAGEHCNQDGINKGLACTLTSGYPTTTQAGNRITLGGGFRPTNEAMIVAFGRHVATLEDFVEAGVPYKRIKEMLLSRLERGKDDRMRREASASRRASQQGRQQGGRQGGRRPEVDYRDERGGQQGEQWGF